jgi:hypothetical protein
MAKLGKNFRITQSGKVEKTRRKLDASAAIRQKTSKRVRVIKKGAAKP